MFTSTGFRAFVRNFDSTIMQERVRHAGERVDYHQYLDHQTIAQVLRLLRRAEGDAPSPATATESFA